MGDWQDPVTVAEMIVWMEADRIQIAEYAAQTAIPTQLWPNES